MPDLSFTMTDADGTTLGEEAAVPNGTDVVLVLTVTNPDGDRPYTADVVHDGELVVAGVVVGPTYSLQLDEVTGDDHAGEWVATLSADGTVVATKSVWLDVVEDGATLVQPAGSAEPEQGRGSDDDVASWAAIGAVTAFVLIGGVTAIGMWGRDEEDVPVVWLVALGLFLLGLLLALLGTYLVVLAAWGGRRPGARRPVEPGRTTAAVSADDIRGAVAVLVLAAICLVGTAWIANGATRTDSPATPTSPGVPAAVTPTTPD